MLENMGFTGFEKNFQNISPLKQYKQPKIKTKKKSNFPKKTNTLGIFTGWL